MGKYIKLFESFTISQDIVIDKFEDEVTLQEYTWLSRGVEVKLHSGQLYKLNLFFKKYYTDVTKYPFSVSVKSFGGISAKISGSISLHGTSTSRSNMKPVRSEITFNWIIEGVVDISMGDDRGSRNIYIHKTSIEEVISFFREFEENIKDKYYLDKA